MYFMKSIRAFSLPTVIVVSILICILVLFAISLFDFNNFYYSYYHRTRYENTYIDYFNNDSFVLLSKERM